MSWSDERGDHEGWDAAEFPGDRFSVGGAGGGAWVRAFPPGPGRLRDRVGEEETGVDGRESIGWRGLCECGWRGPFWERVYDPRKDNPAERRIYDPDPSPYGDPPPGVEDLIHREWIKHLPAESLIRVGEAAAALSQAQYALDEAARAARNDGQTWDDIAAHAGMSVDLLRPASELTDGG